MEPSVYLGFYETHVQFCTSPPLPEANDEYSLLPQEKIRKNAEIILNSFCNPNNSFQNYHEGLKNLSLIPEIRFDFVNFNLYFLRKFNLSISPYVSREGFTCGYFLKIIIILYNVTPLIL
jgi:hypothetical protein